MHKRKLLIGLATAGLLLAGFGAATMPASAEQRTLLVTLVGGAQVTVTVDVAPGTPTDQIQIPGVSDPILSVQDVTPVAPAPAPEEAPPAPAPGPAPAPVEPLAPAPANPDGAQPEPTPSPAPSSSSSPQPAGSPNTPTQEPKAGRQSAQQTTGKAGKPEALQIKVGAATAPAVGPPGKVASNVSLKPADLMHGPAQPTPASGASTAPTNNATR